MNTEEGNKLIASFMGFRRQNDNDDENDGTSIGRYKHWHLGERGHFDDSDLLYHWSWDWLMPVVQKIDKLDTDNFEEWEDDLPKAELLLFNLDEVTIFSNIEVVYKHALAFIQWYNLKHKP